MYKKVIYKKLLPSCSKVKKVQYWIFETQKIFLVLMYLKVDLSVYEMSFMRCWLPSKGGSPRRIL